MWVDSRHLEKSSVHVQILSVQDRVGREIRGTLRFILTCKSDPPRTIRSDSNVVIGDPSRNQSQYMFDQVVEERDERYGTKEFRAPATHDATFNLIQRHRPGF